ncbi:GNAT family protein [Georgenia sp. 10Sc9-8]|uniref:GNAT family protein n=1 Tax=Georgenia halotolerans TaxID=3028317 RepID=A0ABT5U1B0_9MICO|nr:GNAT family protein [Georgenia halotolerans]
MRWPVTLTGPAVVLRPLRLRDRRVWDELRLRNRAWLERWEATSPTPRAPITFRQYVRDLDAQARAGSALPFVMEHEGEMVGQLTVASIYYGSLCSATIGYWISEHVAGRGITTRAVALAADHCWSGLGLHRIEINIRPENTASLRVVEKLGFREEGVRRRYLHIDGDWRDHRSFALTAEEVPGGLLARLPAAGTR